MSKSAYNPCETSFCQFHLKIVRDPQASEKDKEQALLALAALRSGLSNLEKKLVRGRLDQVYQAEDAGGIRERITLVLLLFEDQTVRQEAQELFQRLPVTDPLYIEALQALQKRQATEAQPLLPDEECSHPHSWSIN